MSIPFTTLNTFCRDVVVPKIVDNIYMDNILTYRLLKSAKKYKGGEYIEIPIDYGKNTNAEFYADDATLTSAKVETSTKVRYAPVRSNTGVTLEGIAIAMNAGEGKVLDLVKEKMKGAEKALKDLFGDNLYNTTQSNSFIGLHTICAADGGAGSELGGVTGGPNGDATEWLSSSGTLGTANGPDSSTTALTKLILDKQYNSCKIGNDHPTIGITTDEIWSGIMTKYLMEHVRYTNSDTKLADLGFENFKYRKATFFSDDKCDSGDLFFLNEDHLYFLDFPNMKFKWIDFATTNVSDVQKGHIRWYGVLVCDSRRTQGWMSTISSVT